MLCWNNAPSPPPPPLKILKKNSPTGIGLLRMTTLKKMFFLVVGDVGDGGGLTINKNTFFN